MEKLLLIAMATLISASTITASSCTLSTPTTYTTTDASVLTSIAYISTFALTCSPPTTSNQNLYAVEQVTGTIVPLGLVGDNSYQISVVKEVTSQTKGDHTFKIYNDEGLSQLKKKLAAVPLGTVVLNHPGAYNGPWLNSEHLAALLGIVVGYAAISGKGKLLS